MALSKDLLILLVFRIKIGELNLTISLLISELHRSTLLSYSTFNYCHNRRLQLHYEPRDLERPGMCHLEFKTIFVGTSRVFHLQSSLSFC